MFHVSLLGPFMVKIKRDDRFDSVCPVVSMSFSSTSSFRFSRTKIRPHNHTVKHSVQMEPCNRWVWESILVRRCKTTRLCKYVLVCIYRERGEKRRIREELKKIKKGKPNGDCALPIPTPTSKFHNDAADEYPQRSTLLIRRWRV